MRYTQLNPSELRVFASRSRRKDFIGLNRVGKAWGFQRRRHSGPGRVGRLCEMRPGLREAGWTRRRAKQGVMGRDAQVRKG